MLEYARWKYILIVSVLLVALLFALPNVFSSAPALTRIRSAARRAAPPAGRIRLGARAAARPQGSLSGHAGRGHLDHRLSAPARRTSDELVRRQQRSSDGAVPRRSDPAAGSGRRGRQVSGGIYLGSLADSESAGVLSRAGTEAHAAGPGSERRPRSPLPGGHQQRRAAAAAELFPGLLPGAHGRQDPIP